MRADVGQNPDQGVISRRTLLGGLGASVAGAALLGACRDGSSPAGAAASGSGDPADTVVPFHGAHQAGVATPPQDRLLFGAFDVFTDSRRELTDLLRKWSAAAAVLTTGRMIGENDVAAAPPDDTGEADDLGPSKLTMTFGFGPTLFEREGVDRFGIAARRPTALAPLPTFAVDALEPDHSGGDLAVQVCADDPQVAFHALRNLTRIGRGLVGLRWTQLGFGRTSGQQAGEADQAGTPRNLMGFKDGTNNISGSDTAAMNEHVWIPDGSEPAWLGGGTYLVARRIRMHIEVWDRNSLADQENTFGRQKASGAPIGERREFDTVDLAARSPHGGLLIDKAAHIRLAAPSQNDGVRLLRRGYSFTDGVDPRTAGLDAGLFFIAFVQDPANFIKVQNHLGARDLLNEYIVHTGSALFAVPPGVARGGWIGETLFT